MTPCDWSRYPEGWGELRDAALEAADHRCQGCGVTHREDGTTSTHLTVHHPDRDPENPHARLTVLCAGCHLSVESIARRRERVHESRREGESFAEAWARARSRTIEGQEAMAL
jgi:5-methylcytosine-specific restriction endonuclease McrA